jgi:hypothetical protein
MALAARANVASTRGFLGKRVSRVSNGCRVVMRAGNWLPGKHYSRGLAHTPVTHCQDSE